ncbi:MAG: hypothetical protein E7339_06410 [Clostridiales bacterium]|nr:hypothetical protein [Clostridiales bacterium]
MKKRELSDQLKRATTVIKADRLGVSAGIETVISSEVKNVLKDYFTLSEEVKTQIEVLQSGFNVIIKAKAISVKNVKIIE